MRRHSPRRMAAAARLVSPHRQVYVAYMIKCPNCGGTGPFDTASKAEVACGECGEVFQPSSSDEEQNASTSN